MLNLLGLYLFLHNIILLQTLDFSPILGMIMQIFPIILILGVLGAVLGGLKAFGKI